MAEEVTFSFGANVVQGDDGKAWVQIFFKCGPVTASLTVPEQVATQYHDNMNKQLTEVCMQAYRANLGLLLPGGVKFPTPPQNGKAT
jgi:hypothetical protein